jgi:hypothetical protein
MAKPIAEMTKEELLATLTPFELVDALTDEPDSLIDVDTPIKQACRTLSQEQVRDAGSKFLLRHMAAVDNWRIARGLPPVY